VKRAVFVLALLGACGDNGELHDPLITGECIATFDGNFAEESITPDNCATVRPLGFPEGHLLLRFGIASSVLGATLGVTLDLGVTPAPGHYTSTTLAPWSALALHTIGDGGCVYIAGDRAVPPGAFTLDLAALVDETAHGRLAIEQNVLAITGTDCGPGSVETVTIEF